MVVLDVRLELYIDSDDCGIGLEVVLPGCSFSDERFGNPDSVGKLSICELQNLPAGLKTFSFEYKYVLGYCSDSRGIGSGPELSLKIGDTLVWGMTVNVQTSDYPFDAQCGGSPTGYSPTQQAKFVYSGIGGTLEMFANMADRNIHVVGLGLKMKGTIAESSNAPI